MGARWSAKGSGSTAPSQKDACYARSASRRKSLLNRGLNKTCYGFFSALANPTRLAIMEKLMDRELSVSELAAALSLEQSMISHNLKLLERCSLVFSETRGRNKYVTANADTGGALLRLVERHGEKYCEHYGRCPYHG